MEKDGWIKSRTERNRNRPMRQVYAVTRKGETEFQRLLREVIASYEPGGSVGVFSLNYLHELEPRTAAALLKERKTQVELRAKQLREIPDNVLELHPALDLITEQCQLELRWLRKKINELNSLARSESAA
jgi:DNA-binding PadR family transcriptional regulator